MYTGCLQNDLLNTSAWVKAWVEFILFPHIYEQNEGLSWERKKKKNGQYEISALFNVFSEQALWSADSTTSKQWTYKYLYIIRSAQQTK